jgi:opacity protein-like surface antigen
VGFGYAYINHPITSSNRVGMGGFDVSSTFGLSSRFGLRLDFSQTRSSNGLLGAPAHSSLMSYMAGPVFYPAIGRRVDVYVQGLFGGAKVSGPISVSGGILIGGYATGLAWSFGGGVDYRLTNSLGVRGGIDYLRAGYFGPALTVQGQSNVRTTVSVIYQFGQGSAR